MTYNPGYSMDLGRNWDWDTRKLPCKIRPESGNPAIDELRQRLSDLTGVPIPDAPAKKENQQLLIFCSIYSSIMFAFTFRRVLVLSFTRVMLFYRRQCQEAATGRSEARH